MSPIDPAAMSFSNIFRYDPETGLLHWAQARHGRGCVAGQESGSITNGGRYRSVVVDGRRYYSHRIVWELRHGPLPAGLCIDHINGDGLNNRISNLRLVSRSLNQRNAKLPKNNRLGIHGIYPRKDGFEVRCGATYVGWFKDFFIACCARKSAESATHFHPNHGRTSS